MSIQSFKVIQKFFSRSCDPFYQIYRFFTKYQCGLLYNELLEAQIIERKGWNFFLFGYVKPFQPELKMKEYEAYRSVYCGLCKELGHRYGLFSRFTLSYDFTFLAILAMALSKKDPSISAHRCTFNPLKKCACCNMENVTASIADQAMVTLYYKCLDQLEDEKGLAKFPAWILLPYLRRCWKKASKHVPDYDRAAAEMVLAQKKAENARLGPDGSAEPTALCLASTCTALTEDETGRRVLSRFGYLLGRYVYLSDALDDLEKDEKKHRYNPFLLNNTAAELKALTFAPAVHSINATIAELMKTVDLLTLSDWDPVVKNIIYYGLKQSLNKILQKKENMA